MTIKERILSFLKEKGISKASFYKETGFADANFKGVGLKSELGGEKIVKVLTIYPELSPNWLLMGEGEMLRNGRKFEAIPQISSEAGIGTPYYDVDFMGGFSEILNSQTTVPACNIVVPGFEKATVWCNVTGHSMEPKITHGDIIALRECELRDIQYGEIYAVVLDTIRTIKILRKGSTSELLRYVPINIKDFDEQEYEISRIIKIFEVIGSISKFF